MAQNDAFDVSKLLEQISTFRPSDQRDEIIEMMVALILVVVIVILLVLGIGLLIFQQFVAFGIALFAFVAAIVIFAKLGVDFEDDGRVRNDPKKVRAIVSQVLKVDVSSSELSTRAFIGLLAVLSGGTIGLAVVLKILLTYFEDPLIDGYKALGRSSKDILPNASEWTYLFVMTLIILGVLFGVFFAGLLMFRIVRGNLLPSRYKHSFGYDLQTYAVRLLFFVPLLIAIALGGAIQRWVNEANLPSGLGLLIVITVPIAGVILPLLIFDVFPMMWAKRPLKRGDYATVMRRVERLMRYQMRKLNAEGLKANVLFYQGQFAEAEAIWREYAKQVPSTISDVTPRRLENLGWAVMFQERYQEATEIFLAILEIKPSWNGAYLGLAEICLFQNQTPEHATLLANQAVSLGGGWFDRDRRGLFWATYGWALVRNRQHQASEDAIQKALEIINNSRFSPNYASTLFRVAMTKKEMGDLATASDYFDQVQQIDSQGFYGKRATAELPKLGFAETVS